jgi:hypothetical protein
MRRPPAARLPLGAGLAGALLFAWQCRAAVPEPAPRAPAVSADSAGGWNVVYAVLQHPRCLNCHPAGDAPLQGDAREPHAQNVQRGPDGHGLFAMNCATCHQSENKPGPHLPPGAPNWHMPHPDMPLVFEGLSSSELCRRLRDPAQNGGKTPAALLEHMRADPLVLWGWDPGEGRAPVPVPHSAFAAAAQAWVEGGCECP